MPGDGNRFGSSDQRLLSSDGLLSWSAGKHYVSLYAQKWQVLQRH